MMMRISLTIVLLLAFSPGSLRAGQVSQSQAGAVVKDFQGFWNEFRQAIKANDIEKAASMTRFPFKVNGVDDSVPVKTYNRETFPKVWGKLLQQIESTPDSKGNSSHETMKQLIERKETVSIKDIGTESFVRVGDFEFEKAKGKWVFTRAYLDE